MYQQNHIGVYYTDNYGDSWNRIDKGLPYDFGFPLALHPRDPETCYVIPLRPEEGAFRATSGQLAVHQRTAKGWKAHTKGLPAEGAYLGVLREGMASDPLDPCGIYFGTSTGHLFSSADEGRSWKAMAEFLPPIFSVSATVV